MSVLASKEFWAATAERAIKTFAGALLAVLVTASSTPLDIDWKEALATAGLATLTSVLMSIASTGVGNRGPSLATEQLVSNAPAPQPLVGVVQPPVPPAV